MEKRIAVFLRKTDIEEDDVDPVFLEELEDRVCIISDVDRILRLENFFYEELILARIFNKEDRFQGDLAFCFLMVTGPEIKTMISFFPLRDFHLLKRVLPLLKDLRVSEESGC